MRERRSAGENADSTGANRGGGPLAGLLVTDLSRALAGPHAAMMLGDLGARVIKVENPVGGDDSRGYGPPFVGPAGERISTYYLSCNRNKESLALDLKHDGDRELLRELIRRSDVLIENFRPGVLDRLGFPPGELERLNPRLVTLSVTGFGHDGPEGHRAGFDAIAQGEGGLMSLTGSSAEDVQRVGVPITDLLAGIYGAYGVMAALHERDRTGIGSFVRTSLLAASIGAHAFQGTRWTVGEEVPTPTGNDHPAIWPYGLFATGDGDVLVACGSQGLWEKFAAEFSIDASNSRVTSNEARVENREHVRSLVESAFADEGAQRVLERLTHAGVPAGRVRTLDEVYSWEQTKSQGLVLSVEHPQLGEITLPGPPLRFNDNPFAGGRESHAPPPALDQHGAALRAWLHQSPQAQVGPSEGVSRGLQD